MDDEFEYPRLDDEDEDPRYEMDDEFEYPQLEDEDEYPRLGYEMKEEAYEDRMKNSTFYFGKFKNAEDALKKGEERLQNIRSCMEKIKLLRCPDFSISGVLNGYKKEHLLFCFSSDISINTYCLESCIKPLNELKQEIEGIAEALQKKNNQEFNEEYSQIRKTIEEL